MPRRLFVFTGLLFALLLSAVWLVPGRVVGAIDATTPAVPSSTSALMFIENVGQFADDARFQVRGSDRTIWLAEDVIWVTLWEPTVPSPLPDPEADLLDEMNATDAPRRGVNIRLSFVGANPAPEVEATEALSRTISYFYGNDPEGWRPDVPVWGNVRYADLYPGLDLELTGQGSTLAPRLVCHAADCATALAAVQLEVAGAEEVTLAEEGVLIETAVGTWRLPLLAVVDAVGRPVEVDMAEAAVVGERVERPFASQPISRTLSPTPDADDDSPAGNGLLYSTFLGSELSEDSSTIAVDGAGNAFITGYTIASDFPVTPGAFDDTFNGVKYDVFVTKFSAAGDALLYSTFLGGQLFQQGYDIVVDGAGNAFITGNTASPDFPVTPGAFDTTYDGNYDAFVTKLNADGSDLLYSTFLGDEAGDHAQGIAVDEAGHVFATGVTSSPNFPTTSGAFDTSLNGSVDIFITKLNATGSDLLYSTFLGGVKADNRPDIAIDGTGNAFIIGSTASLDFPTTPGAYDTTYNGGPTDVFVTKLNADGSALSYSTFLGGESRENGRSIAVDGAGNALLTGSTYSANFPTTPGAFDTTHNSGYDAFVTKLNADGSDLLYSTFLGGDGWEYGQGIAVDEAGNAFVTGRTESQDFPTTLGAFSTTYNGGFHDVFVTQLNAEGSGLLYSTFLGGEGWDGSEAIIVDGAGNAFITGNTSSTDFPTTAGAFDTSYNDGTDIFVTKLVPENAMVAYFAANPTSGVAPLEVAFSNLSSGNYDTCLWVLGDGNNSSDCLGPVHTYMNPGSFTVSLTITGTEDTSTLTLPDYIVVYEPVAASFTVTPTAGISPLTIYLTNLSTGDYNTCLWTFDDGGSSSDCDEPDYTYTSPGTYTVTLTVMGPGGEDSWTAVDPIMVYEPVTAGFSATPTTGLAPLAVAFTNLSSGSFSSSLWDFGDGITSTLTHPVHEYVSPGSYTVTLSVSGPGGTDMLTMSDFITVYEPVAAHFTAVPTGGPAPLTVSFTNLSTGDYDTCLWDFGDGDTSAECDDPDHTYDITGSYTVSLTVTGLGGEDTFTAVDPIMVYEPVTAGFSATPTSGNAPLLVQFTNLSSGDYDTCQWDFGDGSTSTECEDPSHTYETPGSYIVSLAVTGPGGEDSLTAVDPIMVYEPVTAGFSATPTSGAAPLLVQFTNLSTGDYDTCLWDFGDGSTSAECDDPDHTYDTPGSYDVSLTVTGPEGEDTFATEDLITVYEPVTAGFTATSTSGNVPLLVQFTNLATGDYDTCLWDFGDGSTSDECDNPTHTYTAPGTYTVTLTISGPGGEDTLVQEGYIAVKLYQLFLPVMVGAE